jgi:hypothetical protein
VPLNLTACTFSSRGRASTSAARSFVPVRPPYYDAPETLGFFDAEERVFFSADSFGALLSEPATDLDAISTDALRDGLVTWASIDAPWLAHIDRATFGSTLSAIERFGPEILLSGHLPATRGGVKRLTSIVHDAWSAGRTSEGSAPPGGVGGRARSLLA